MTNPNLGEAGVYSNDNVRTIAEQLRCPTCTAQSVADSNAPIARTLRAEITQKLGQNKTNQQILNELAESYGEHILLSPPVTFHTYLLWFFPFLVLVFLIIGWLRKQKVI